jgi:hypothetical protein
MLQAHGASMQYRRTPRLLLIDSQLLKVPSQRTAVILVQRAAGDPGCADLAISAKQC